MNRQLHLQEMIILAGPAQWFTDQGSSHCLGLWINWKQFGNLRSKASSLCLIMCCSICSWSSSENEKRPGKAYNPLLKESYISGYGINIQRVLIFKCWTSSHMGWLAVSDSDNTTCSTKPDKLSVHQLMVTINYRHRILPEREKS